MIYIHFLEQIILILALNDTLESVIRSSQEWGRREEFSTTWFRSS